MKTWVLDAGPMVALLNPEDGAHEIASVLISQFNGRLVTTNAVVTEAMHLLGRYAKGPTLLLEFLETTAAHVADFCQFADLHRAVDLMAKYEDTPMDFADATLVLLADRLGLREIFTLDRRGFSTFRTLTGKRFNLVM